ncbi:MAG: mannonate dehydratase, partial [Rhizobiales bacterium]|nr:mannonate dehydratase [Hyphomicrobiales bacterium]
INRIGHYISVIILKALGYMCIHPDDPPISLFGLPRVVKDVEDLEYIFSAGPDINNGLTLCTGSFGAINNDLIEIAERYSDRIHFAHLRNVTKQEDGSFYEAEHLEGDVDIIGVISILIIEEKWREKIGRVDINIPLRPDHGHLLLDDQQKECLPGYSLIGRLKGLAELRGIIRTIEYMGVDSAA